MSTRKYLSGYEKRKKKRKIEEFLQSQVGAMDKFLSNTSNVDKEIYEKHMLEQIDFNSLIIDFLSKSACRINLQ